MENDTKRRILYLYQHLVRHTDAEHTLSTAELMKILKETYAIQVSRNTISDDLAMLHDCGLHIEHYKSTQNRYYYDGQIYELPELKILVDAIASSRFITQRKSDELIAKLLTLTSSRMPPGSAATFTQPAAPNRTTKTAITLWTPSTPPLTPGGRYPSATPILT